jgi:uncharacterized membrane protein YkvA (DUF1232 family)
MIDILIDIAIGLAISWLALVIALILIRPRGNVLKEALRILPDVLRLLKRLATDKRMPLSVRVRLWALFVYIAIPFDPIPDFLPLIGYADEAIITVFVLRGVAKRVGSGAIVERWPGSGDGLKVLERLTKLDLSPKNK